MRSSSTLEVPSPRLADEMILTNARVVTAEECFLGTVVVRDGVISEIDRTRSGLARAVDADGDHLLPGLIDLHTDNLEKHLVPRPGVQWNPVAASLGHDSEIAAAGITTVYDALSLSVEKNKDARRDMLEPSLAGLRVAEHAGLLRAQHRVHLRCEVTNPEIMAIVRPVIGHPLVGLMSIMDHAPGHRQFPDVAEYRRRYVAAYGYTEADIDAHIAERMRQSRELGPANRLALAALGRERGFVMASHDDETEAHVMEASDLGMTISEFPTTLVAAEKARAMGMAILMGAPNVVRNGSHSGNIGARELARRGLLDVLSSDYVPQAMVHATFLLAEDESIAMNLPQAVATVSRNPARLARLHDRGEIGHGLRADLIRVRRCGNLSVVRSVYNAGRLVIGSPT